MPGTEFDKARLARPVNACLALALVVSSALLVKKLGFLLFWRGGAGSNSSHILYAVGAAAMAGACAWLLRSSLTLRIQAVVLFISVGSGAYLVESAFFIKQKYWPVSAERAHIQEMREAARALKVDFDPRTRIEVAEDFIRAGKDAVPVFKIRRTEIHDDSFYPLAGVPDQFTVYCNENGKFITYQSDEYGFRNPPGSYSGLRPDVALLGDSFAHGACVEEGETFAGRLRAHSHSVLNLGQGGTGPLHQLAAAVEYLEERPPKTVFWLYCEGNDAQDLDEELGSPLLRRYLDEPGFRQGLAHRRDSVKAKVKEIANRVLATARNPGRPPLPSGMEIYKGLTLSFLRERLGLLPSLPRTVEYPRQYRRVVERFREQFPQTRLVLVFLPDYLRVVGGLKDHQAERDGIEALASELKLDFIDPSSALLASPDTARLFALRMSNHYSPEGYALIAELLNERLAGARSVAETKR